ncbi:hypothetical protein JOB18_019676 [Solea senegalensis]|uniref:Uncharacterized protein n=1 Tax=Solea senegalensis TaxID=28829 RepID=A0AAV6RQX2_SOLSE|nr:hypothetical protein JOB18_019676 [Solea senegalensis]
MSSELSTFRTAIGGQLLTVEDLSRAERSAITLETAPFRVLVFIANNRTRAVDAAPEQEEELLLRECSDVPVT